MGHSLAHSYGNVTSPNCLLSKKSLTARSRFFTWLYFFFSSLPYISFQDKYLPVVFWCCLFFTQAIEKMGTSTHKKITKNEYIFIGSVQYFMKGKCKGCETPIFLLWPVGTARTRLLKSANNTICTFAPPVCCDR
jgi:hypothetical protein